jgi:hypothetical protein
MPQINRSDNLFSFTTNLITSPGWEVITNEEWNQLLQDGWACNEYIPPYRVSKDTIVSRVSEAGKTAELMAAISSLTPEQQFFWTNFAWFWSNNATLIGMCAQLGLDASIILAPDPFLT